MNATELVNKAWNDGLTPPPMTLVSEWADKNRFLPESAPEPGEYRTARTPYMRDIMDCLSPSSMAREIDLMKGTQTGGPLCLTTPIPTPDGWTTMDEIAIGDRVFDENGKVCNVTGVSEVFTGRQCYRITFSDHSDIVCDASHLWSVDDEKKSGRPKHKTLRTENIVGTFKHGNRNRYAIPLPKPLDLPKADLLIGPYALGAWLGDGTAGCNQITTHALDGEMAEYICDSGHKAVVRRPLWSKGHVINIIIDPVEKTRVMHCIRGHELASVGTFETHRIGRPTGVACSECRRQHSMHWQYGKVMDPVIRAPRFFRRLRTLGLIKNKHIPQAYLRASYAQRLELLQGLMDTDGYIDERGSRSEFSTTSKILSEQVCELLFSLGLKPVVYAAEPRAKKVPSAIVTKSVVYRVSFLAYADQPVFKLKRKLSRMASTEGRRVSETKRRRITNVEPIESVPVRCIEVDSANHLFLAGKQMVPTHNTEAAYNWIGFIVDQAPSNILCVLPDQATAKEWSQQRLTQLIENTPCLKGKIKEPRDRDGGNATFTKKFGAAYLKMAWASSAKKMRSTPAQNIIADEIDGFVRDTGEGSPIALLKRRFTNYPEGKFLRISTPTDRSNSLIEQGFLEGDQRYFFVPCPFCKHFQVITFKQIRWDKGDYSSVYLKCIACESQIPERFKTGILSRGRWIATKGRTELVKSGVPEDGLADLDRVFRTMRVERHPSFHLSALYSPLGWYGWDQVAEDWEKAQRNTRDLRTFANTVLGESWLEQGAAPEWELLYERSGGTYSAGTAPYGVLFLTAGVDVQGDRLEVEIVGWGRNFHSWSIDYHVILGDPKDTETWDKLEAYLRKPVEHASGNKIQISAIGVDTGYGSKSVYQFSRRFPRAVHGHGRSYIARPLTLVPTKGGHSGVKLIESISSEDAARTRKGLKIITIGTHTAKQELYDWLRARPTVDPETGQMKLPFGYTFYPRYEPSYFQGLCSETRVVRENGKIEWLKDPSVRNEPLDCRIIARAMASLYGMDRFTEKHWIELEESLRPLEQEAPAATPTPVNTAPVPTPTPVPMPQPARSQPVQPYQPVRSNWMRR